MPFRNFVVLLLNAYLNNLDINWERIPDFDKCHYPWLGLGKGGFSLGKKNQAPDLTDSVKK